MSIELPASIREFQPEIGVILGSGLGFFADDRIEPVFRLPYGEIEGFPVSTVPGHAGQFVCGHLEGKRVICMQGRFHFYEGYTLQQVTLPVRLMHAAGIHTLMVTNAAGGINRSFAAGDLMLLGDHINYLGTNPLIGDRSGDGVLFPDMTVVYDQPLRQKVKQWAADRGMRLHEGVYLATSGPSYETPAEIRAFAVLGADAVGMSTVPEAIVARKLGVRVLAISCITNLASGISEHLLTHEEVAETAGRVRHEFADLLTAAVSFS